MSRSREHTLGAEGSTVMPMTKRYDDAFHARKRAEMARANAWKKRHASAVQAATLGKKAADDAIARIEDVLADLRTTEYEQALKVCQGHLDRWLLRIIAAAPFAEGPEWPQHNGGRGERKIG